MPMAFSGIPLKRGFTILCDHPFAEYIRLLCPREAHALVCYYIPQKARFCLGIWRDKVRGIVQEVASWDKAGTELDFAKVDFITYWLGDKRRTDVIDSVRGRASTRSSEDNQRAAESEEYFNRTKARMRGRIFTGASA